MPSAAIQNSIQLSLVIDADASGAGLSFPVPRDLTIIHATCICTTANAGGTVTVSTPGGQLTSAMACVSLHADAASSVIDVTVATLTSGQVITAVANGAADRGIVYLDCLTTGYPLTVT